MKELIIIRKLEISDLLDIWRWRNNKLTRKYARNNKYIGFNEHKEWFHKALTDNEILIYVGVNKKTKGKLGIIRYNLFNDHKAAEVNINIRPICRNKGIALILLKKTISIFLVKFQIPILAEVKKNNLASLKLFNRAGFSLKEEKNDSIIFEFTK